MMDSRRKILCIGILLLAGCASARNPAGPEAISLRVLAPDGTPAAGAVAALVPSGHTVDIFDGINIDDDPAYERAFVPADGRVRFATMAPPYLLVVVCDAGYAQIDGRELAGRTDVRLQPWGHVEGRLMIGDSPGDGREVAVWTVGGQAPGNPYVVHELETTTAVDGAFRFDHVPSGKLGIGEEMCFYYAGHSAAGYTQRKYFSIEPGQTATVIVGGSGALVVGHLNLPEELKQRSDWQFGICNIVTNVGRLPPPMPDDIKIASLARQQEWYSDFVNTQTGRDFLAAQEKAEFSRDSFPLQLKRDGSFRIIDVPPGSYRLNADAWTERDDGTHKMGEKIAMAEADIKVPEVAADHGKSPIVLADIPMQPFGGVPHPGDLAPDFIAKTLDGRTIRLSDYRGKFVLVDFWATWCGPSVQQTPYLKSVYDHHGRSGRLVMIGLSSDYDPYRPKHYADENGLGWIQCFIGQDSPVQNLYGINGIPSIWLVGPDGKVIAKGFYDEKIEAVVARALGV